jgi:hypothetical protein
MKITTFTHNRKTGKPSWGFLGGNAVIVFENRKSFEIRSLFPLSHGCCDNVLVFGRRKVCRCNDYITPLPLWKKLVQIAFGVHRKNVSEWGKTPHEISGWKLRLLQSIIKPDPTDAPWRWVKTNQYQ